MLRILLVFFTLISISSCCDDKERQIIAAPAHELSGKFLLQETYDTFTSMNFFTVFFKFLNYSDQRQGAPLVFDYKSFKTEFTKIFDGKFFCAAYNDYSAKKRIITVETETNESAYGLFFGCDLYDNKPLLVKIITKDHPLFSANDLEINKAAADFETKNCDCKAIKQHFVQQCSRNPGVSNDFVILLLISVFFIALLYRLLSVCLKRDEGHV